MPAGRCRQSAIVYPETLTEPASAPDPDPRGPTLRRSLGFWALFAYGFGDILGAGIYALIGVVVGRAGEWAWLSFAITTAIALVTASSYAELIRRFPRAGAEAHFVRAAFGRSGPALVVGWLVLGSAMLSMATVAVAFAGYVTTALAPNMIPDIATILYLAVVTAIAWAGIRESSRANIMITIVEASGLLLVIGVGLHYMATAPPPAVELGRPLPAAIDVMQGSALAFFALIGFEDMANVAEEAHHPEKTMPRALLAALLAAATLYMLVVWISTAVVSTTTLARSDAPLLEVVLQAAPAIPPWTFTLVALFAVANTGLLNLVTGSRVLYGLSRQELVPAWLGAVHRRTRTPHRSIAAIAAVVTVLAVSGGVSQLAGATNTLLLVVFFTVNAALFTIKVRRRERADQGGFRVPSAIPAVGMISCAVLVWFVPLTSKITAAVFVVVGCVVVLAHRLHRKTRKTPPP